MISRCVIGFSEVMAEEHISGTIIRARRNRKLVNEERIVHLYLLCDTIVTTRQGLGLFWLCHTSVRLDSKQSVYIHSNNDMYGVKK